MKKRLNLENLYAKFGKVVSSCLAVALPNIPGCPKMQIFGTFFSNFEIFFSLFGSSYPSKTLELGWCTYWDLIPQMVTQVSSFIPKKSCFYNKAQILKFNFQVFWPKNEKNMKFFKNFLIFMKKMLKYMFAKDFRVLAQKFKILCKK